MKAGVEIMLRVIPVTIVFGAAGLLFGAFNARVVRRNSAHETLHAAPAVLVVRDLEPAIEEEARVFAAPMLTANTAERRRTAHPRTLATFRTLRPFPGAPPRIPHGLTADEFRNTRCRTCHERGGYSMRFEAYTPVTPHPELVDCLQCHVADDAVVGVSLPASNPDALCRQCHAPGAATSMKSSDEWEEGAAVASPEADRARLAGAPPPIPHDLVMRSNCVACHAGPAAVEEIRTAHPQWTSCRQCHVAASNAPMFTRVRGTP